MVVPEEAWRLADKRPFSVASSDWEAFLLAEGRRVQLSGQKEGSPENFDSSRFGHPIQFGKFLALLDY